MAEEFQESEVIFGEINGEDSPPPQGWKISSSSTTTSRKKLKAAPAGKENSTPMKIPAAGRNIAWLRYLDAELDGDDHGEMVPPHIIVGRRVAGKMMAFSICSGKGRSLKGRDFCEVRNLILRMTGFLEN
ncbi:uncharacterized protein LOC127254843 [Andrographis paniculata]|uniref:uncharacterized protein LOC127254843 n=1 Tax=Andrographis paniculata TaxID=175694 RepID=UPI0021E97131|nr:uncharacterized protein LOC127254843 [Andrographis paniculata]